MPCPGVGPCSAWDLDLSCCLVSGAIPDPCLSDGTLVGQEIIDSAILTASQFLWAVTGRQFGCCTVNLRPCRRQCEDECCLPSFSEGSFPWLPVHQADGTWTNISCSCENSCSCSGSRLCEIMLPYPVCSVDEVIIDGEIVDPSTYRVDGFKNLVREGDGCWPTCNDLTKPPTEVGTWQVTMTYGRAVPELVKRAAAEFACELIKDCSGRPCRLPRNVTAITRQGITEVFADPNQFLQNGYTGITLIDLAIRAYNPNKIQRRPYVSSPDSDPGLRRTTWQFGDPILPECS